MNFINYFTSLWSNKLTNLDKNILVVLDKYKDALAMNK